jgi:integrase
MDARMTIVEGMQELSPEHWPMFLTAARTGMRRGELLTLKWGDIQCGESENDSNRFISVRRNFVAGKFATPKSKQNGRVDLSKQLRRVLLALRDRRLLTLYLQGIAKQVRNKRNSRATRAWKR